MHIAIIGCGQLSRMLALAGMPMGIRFSFIADADEDTRCVDGFGPIVRWQPEQSAADIFAALGQPDVVTVEKEQVDVAILQALQAHCPVHPNAGAFAVCQHRHQEKQILDRLGIACSPYHYGMPADAGLELPVVVKSCREGYDGKNQWVLRTADEVAGFAALAEEEHYIVERFIPFDREISQVSVRAADGEIRHYPLAENRHEGGILKQSIVPAANVSDTLQTKAQDYIRRLMEELDYVGVMAVECFVVGEELLVNELAPRVHNSGHWSQSGAATCQFENHIRAVAGLPLGDTGSCGVTGMLNLLGTAAPPFAELAANAKLHWYGKTVRPGRKLGHINIVSSDYDSLQRQLAAIEQAIE